MRGSVLVRAMRVHQWVKNLLVFVPLIMAHRLFDREALGDAFQIFLSFCFAASSAYLLNDTIDLDADRDHRHKKNRPIAAGLMSVSEARILSCALALAALFCAWMLSVPSLLCVLIYYLITVLYSVWLKRLVAMDVVVLAGLYTIRILAGGVAEQIAVSQWLLAFSMFFFLSLACLKRFSEIQLVRQNNGDSIQGRGYRANDGEQIAQFGSGSGYLSVLVLALYTSSDEVTLLYLMPELLWLVCPLLLYWVTRVWILARRGEIHDDPILFALSDRTSYVVGAVAALILFLASSL